MCNKIVSKILYNLANTLQVQNVKYCKPVCFIIHKHYICCVNTTKMLPDWQTSALYKLLGTRIKELREEKKYKQEYFASLLKISRASLVNIEQGRQRPPLHNLYEIARILEVTITDLLPALPSDNEVKPNYATEVDKKKIKSPDKLLDFIRSI